MTAQGSSCVTTDSRSISESGATIGKLQAVRTLPDAPADCAAKEAHVRVTKGVDPWSLLAREGAQLDKQNGRTDRCMGAGGFYDRVKASQEAAISEPR